MKKSGTSEFKETDRLMSSSSNSVGFDIPEKVGYESRPHIEYDITPPNLIPTNVIFFQRAKSCCKVFW